MSEGRVDLGVRSHGQVHLRCSAGNLVLLLHVQVAWRDADQLALS